jgi:hypothetical protein
MKSTSHNLLIRSGKRVRTRITVRIRDAAFLEAMQVIRDLKAEKPEHWGGLRVDETLTRLEQRRVS